MALIQQLTQNERDMSGQLVVRAEPGNLAELIALATELQHRPDVVTNGTITQLPPAPPPLEPPPPLG